MPIYMAYYMDMKVANIAEFKNNLSKFLSLVKKGEVIEICKRNIPVAHLIPLKTERNNNYTQLGCGRGSVKIHSNLTEPMIPEESWDTLKE